MGRAATKDELGEVIALQDEGVTLRIAAEQAAAAANLANANYSTAMNKMRVACGQRPGFVPDFETGEWSKKVSP